MLIFGEWYILTLFAARLGPAEVTAWAILGDLWEVFESSHAGIADAAEIRVASHCGKNRFAQAELAAHKSIIIGIFFSVVVTSIFLVLGHRIPCWLTSDSFLQQNVAENIPLICIGNIIMTAGIVAWSAIGAQGRYRLATIVLLLASWCITIPISALSVYGLFLDLKGLTAAVCIGYCVASTALVFILLRSDWPALSQQLWDINVAMENYVSSSDDEDGPASLSNEQSSSSKAPIKSRSSSLNCSDSSDKET